MPDDMVKIAYDIGHALERFMDVDLVTKELRRLNPETVRLLRIVMQQEETFDYALDWAERHGDQFPKNGVGRSDDLRYSHAVSVMLDGKPPQPGRDHAPDGSVEYSAQVHEMAARLKEIDDAPEYILLRKVHTALRKLAK